MNTQAEKLAAKIKAVNTVNTEINRWAPLVLAYLRQFIGQKVMKHAGMLEKIAKGLPACKLHCYRNGSNHSLAFCVKDCQPLPPHSCVYHEAVFYVGDLKGAILGELYAFTPLKADFNAADVQNARAAYKEAKRASDAAFSALGVFGEYDN